MNDFDQLSIDGRIATPDDADWDQVRQAWNLAADPHPEAVALVESADDVAAVIRFCAERGLRVLGQGTGHGAVAVGPLEDTVVIKTSACAGSRSIPRPRPRGSRPACSRSSSARPRPSTACARMPGSSPDVGVTGYTLGGGLSWLGRRYGFACNRVAAIEVVTADGEARDASTPSNEPDLFWALRGGGGGYAIVTAMHLDLIRSTRSTAGGSSSLPSSAPTRCAPTATGPRPWGTR